METYRISEKIKELRVIIKDLENENDSLRKDNTRIKQEKIRMCENHKNKIQEVSLSERDMKYRKDALEEENAKLKEQIQTEDLLKKRIKDVITEREYWEKKYNSIFKKIRFYKRTIQFLHEGLEELE